MGSKKTPSFDNYYQGRQITGITRPYQGAFWDNRPSVITGKNYSSPVGKDYHMEIQIKYDYTALNTSFPTPIANLSQFTIITTPLITRLTNPIRDRFLRHESDRFNSKTGLQFHRLIQHDYMVHTI